MVMLIIGLLIRLDLIYMLRFSLKGGCIIVDSTRKGKRFPDSMSKTIPIWTCVLNRAIFNHLNKELQIGFDKDVDSINWDCSLHLPLWISKMEKSSIEHRLEEWTEQLESSGADISSLASCLQKPLRPLWISPKTLIWLNEIPEHDSWDFTPIILVSASSSSGHYYHRNSSEISWNYISGAGDDEESWARGLTPDLFWNHAYDLINAGPDYFNLKIADIVEKDRVRRAQRGQYAPQIFVKGSKRVENTDHLSEESLKLDFELQNFKQKSNEECAISWLGSTNLAVCATQYASRATTVDCMLNCDKELVPVSLPDANAYLHLPILNSKLDRFSLLNSLPTAVSFARSKLIKGKTLSICCQDGEDIAVCVCLAILTSLFNDAGVFDDGKSLQETCITKQQLQRRLIFICKFATNARPSRGNLKQVFSFLGGGRDCRRKKLAMEEQ